MKIKFYPVISICRRDLIDYFTKEEIKKLTDKDMKFIASNIAIHIWKNNKLVDSLISITQELLDNKEL